MNRILSNLLNDPRIEGLILSVERRHVAPPGSYAIVCVLKALRHHNRV
jgi:hypothetical protein